MAFTYFLLSPRRPGLLRIRTAAGRAWDTREFAGGFREIFRQLHVCIFLTKHLELAVNVAGSNKY